MPGLRSQQSLDSQRPDSEQLKHSILAKAEAHWGTAGMGNGSRRAAA